MPRRIFSVRMSWTRLADILADNISLKSWSLLWEGTSWGRITTDNLNGVTIGNSLALADDVLLNLVGDRNIATWTQFIYNLNISLHDAVYSQSTNLSIHISSVASKQVRKMSADASHRENTYSHPRVTRDYGVTVNPQSDSDTEYSPVLYNL